MEISLIICTHNPKKEYIKREVESLKRQSLSHGSWELIVVDNASKESISKIIDISWHENSKIIKEETLGLTSARIKGVESSSGSIIVFADDDNLLDEKYLENVKKIFKEHLNLGIAGGHSIPEYQEDPPEWFLRSGVSLGTRRLSDRKIISSFRGRVKEYPSFAPIGAGMVLRREVFEKYCQQIEKDPERLSFGRKGNRLTSGEDNDIVLAAIENGWEIGYFPELSLVHIIPGKRVKKKYLARLNYDSSYSWIKVLDKHNINPWGKIPRWTVFPRKLKAFFSYKAWRGPIGYIKWRGACGMYKALGEI